MITEEFVRKVARGTRFATVSEKLKKDYMENLQKFALQWDHAFSCYVMAFSALHGVAEDFLTEAMVYMKPSHQDRLNAMAEADKTPMPANCKMSRAKFRKRRYEHTISQQYPWYEGYTRKCIDKIDPQFFETWASGACSENGGIIVNIVDQSLDYLKRDSQLLYFAVKQEMDKRMIEHSRHLASLYCCYLTYKAILALHRQAMLIGPISPMEEKEWKALKGRRIEKPGDSPYYTKAFEDHMLKACPMQNFTYIEHLYNTLLPNFKHLTLSVDNGVKILTRKAMSDERMLGFDMSGVLKDAGWEYEIELLNKIQVYRTQELGISIHLLRSVREVLNGATLHQIEEHYRYGKNVVSREEMARVLLTCEICRRVNNGTLDIDELNHQMFLKKHSDDYDPKADGKLDVAELGAQGISDLVDVVQNATAVKMSPESPSPRVSRKRWSDEEKQWLRQNWHGSQSLAEARKHIGRTDAAIVTMANRLKSQQTDSREG